MYTPVQIFQTKPLLVENYSQNYKSFEQIKSKTFSSILLSSTLMSTLILFDLIQNHEKFKQRKEQQQRSRSTPLPGWGIFGDRVNELIEIFLDTLAVYIHNDNKWNNCPQRLLCEANQRAVDYGTFYGILTYFSSLFVSFWLQNRRVTSSMEAMRKGRQGQNCIQQYPCPFSL